jgi:hypothetical protein
MRQFLKHNSNVGLLFLFAVIGFTVVSFQNCAPSGGGSAFQIGLGTSASSSPLSISQINLSQTTMSPSAAFTASATVTDSGSNSITCQWKVTTSANVLVSSPTPTAATNSCAYSGSAPAAGSYILSLVVTDANQNSAQVNAAFQVTGATPTPVPVFTPTPTPSSCLALGTRCNEYVTSDPTPGECNLCCASYQTTCMSEGEITLCTSTCE